MINNRKAAYVIQEIRNIPFYQSLIEEHQAELKKNEQKKEMLSSPKSPQGHENIGAGNQMSIDSVQDRMVELFDYDMEIEEKIKALQQRKQTAESYYSWLIQGGANEEFINDYFHGLSMYELEHKHNVSNAYDKMIRIIKNVIITLNI